MREFSREFLDMYCETIKVLRAIENRRDRTSCCCCVNRSLSLKFYYFVLFCIFVRPDWLLVRSKLAPGLTNDLPIDKNYLQACFTDRSANYWRDFRFNCWLIQLNGLLTIWCINEIVTIFIYFRSYVHLHLQGCPERVVKCRVVGCNCFYKNCMEYVHNQQHQQTHQGLLQMEVERLSCALFERVSSF